jgi:hypothetical protein
LAHAWFVNTKPKKRYVLLRVALGLITTVLAGIVVFCFWLSAHYKSIVMERVPLMITRSSDSIYHISFSDISINIFKHNLTLVNVHLWPDTNRVNILRQRNNYAPNTVSIVFAPKIEVYGIRWDDIVTNKSFDSKDIVVYNPKCVMRTIKHHPDLSMIEEKKGHSLIKRFSAARLTVINPDFTYQYSGDKNNYIFFSKGGKVVVADWAIDEDITKDTSTILYAKNGILTPDSFIFQKDGRCYCAKAPNIEFTTAGNSVTVKNVRIKQMQDMEQLSGRVLEVYNFNFPEIELVDFNWKKLLNDNTLLASCINVSEPYIDVRYVRAYFPIGENRVGRFPHQIIREAIKTNIRSMQIKNGTIKYTEPGKNGKEGTVAFNDINGSITNITNLDTAIACNKDCIVKLHGRYMHKSEVAATFYLSLADPKGHFSVDGFVNNLDGADVTEQAAAFTMAEVTSFHLSHMNMHMEGNEAHTMGSFTMCYQDFKVSFFKFKGEARKKPNGPLAFLADALLIYPANPMSGKDLRKTETSFPRDTGIGFIGTIWENMYRGAQKTVVRDQRILDVAGAKAGNEDMPKKNSFFRRLFKGNK